MSSGQRSTTCIHSEEWTAADQKRFLEQCEDINASEDDLDATYDRARKWQSENIG